MSFFRKYKTIEEVMPGFLLKKETEISHKAAMCYHSMCLALADWLKDQGKEHIPMRELMDQLRHTKLDATQHYLKKHCGIINTRIRNNFPDPTTPHNFTYSNI